MRSNHDQRRSRYDPDQSHLVTTLGSRQRTTDHRVHQNTPDDQSEESGNLVADFPGADQADKILQHKNNADQRADDADD